MIRRISPKLVSISSNAAVATSATGPAGSIRWNYEDQTLHVYNNDIPGGYILSLSANSITKDMYLNNVKTSNSSFYVYNNNNTVNTLTVATATTVIIKSWGSSGGNGSYSTSGSSGAGGYAEATVTLQPNTTYYIYVGEGGKGPSGASFGLGGAGGWPNGGFGTSGDATGAGGGGMTMISTAEFNTSMSDSSIVLIAGAGGGSTGYNGAAGAGGGTSGQSATYTTGGTQSIGGTYNGSKLQGGNATGTQSGGSDDGGGGGGGYYGGGGGTSDAKPGSGGSGYYNTSICSNVTLGTGTSTAVYTSTDLLSGYSTGATDVGGSPQNGKNGLVYILVVG